MLDSGIARTLEHEFRRANGRHTRMGERERAEDDSEPSSPAVMLRRAGVSEYEDCLDGKS